MRSLYTIAVSLSVLTACASNSRDEFVERFAEIDGALFADYVQPLQHEQFSLLPACDPGQPEPNPQCAELVDRLDALDAALLTAADRIDELRLNLPEDEREIASILEDMVEALRLMYEADQSMVAGWRSSSVQLWQEGLAKRAEVQDLAADYTARLKALAENEQ